MQGITWDILVWGGGLQFSTYRVLGIREPRSLSTEVLHGLPRGSTCTTIGELGPIIPSIVWYFGAKFPNSCIYGPSGLRFRENFKVWGILGYITTVRENEMPEKCKIKSERGLRAVQQRTAWGMGSTRRL